MLSITLIYWCLAKYICAGLQAQFFKKSFNHKMIAVKQTNKITHIEWSVFKVALHKVFGELNEMIATLLFANLVCSLTFAN